VKTVEDAHMDDMEVFTYDCRIFGNEIDHIFKCREFDIHRDNLGANIALLGCAYMLVHHCCIEFDRTEIGRCDCWCHSDFIYTLGPNSECISVLEAEYYMSEKRDMIMHPEHIYDIQEHLGMCEYCLESIEEWEGGE